MKKPLRSRFTTRKNLLKRRSGWIAADIFRAATLLCTVGTMGSALILSFNLLVSCPLFAIQQTVVRGCRELTEKDVLSLATIRSSQNILAVNTEAIATRVRANPWISQVHVGRELPDRLIIEIKEHNAVAIMRRDDGLYLLDSGCVPFKKLELGDDADVPILSGFYYNGRTNGKLLDEAMSLMNRLNGSKTAIPFQSISEIQGDDVTGLTILADNGLSIQFGLGNYENKLSRLMPIMNDLAQRGQNMAFMHIDLSDPTKITIQRNLLTPPQRAIADRRLST
jgi:cell division protein FtsQ